MTVEKSLPEANPSQPLFQLHASESNHAITLMEVMAVIKPAKSSQSSLSSIVRGLHTKNTRILSILDQSLLECESEQDGLEVLKCFVNEFILWLDDGHLSLLNKYSDRLIHSEDATNFDSKCLNNPIENLTHYITFIKSCSQYLRNPFILKELTTIKTKLETIVHDFNKHLDLKRLNAIRFTNIRTFGSSQLTNKQLVSSYFTIDQIVERSMDNSLFITFNNTEEPIELVLLDLAGTGVYNSLAILSVDFENGTEVTRSLIYPPFRLNEVSISFTTNKLELRAINFSSTLESTSSENDTITIICDDSELLQNWIAKLSAIFPMERSDSPVKELNFLEPQNSPSKMLGLGIDMVDSANPSMENVSIVRTPAPQSKLSNLIQDIPTISNNRSNESLPIKEQYDRSLPIIKKTLSTAPLGIQNNIQEEDDDDDGDEFLFQMITRDLSSRLLIPETHDRPVSSRAELIHEDAESIVGSEEEDDEVPPIQPEMNQPQLRSDMKRLFASSVPDLGVKEKKSTVYQLSTGSAIDLANFGKKHQPSFASTESLLIKQKAVAKPPRQRRKSLFSIFKKSSRPIMEDISPGFEAVQGPNKVKENVSKPAPIPPVVPVVVEPEVEKKPIVSKDSLDNESEDVDLEKKRERATSSLPAPFALPSSTSTYFFKPYRNSTATNLQTTESSPLGSTDEKKEESLCIPQNLKDVINLDDTIDFFISSSSPKAMKISKWKEKYGKWEMITVSERLFVKTVMNYELKKCWLIVFKEEFDIRCNHFIDIPLLLLDITPNITDIRRSAALDLQISSINSITSEQQRIIIRCTTGALINSIFTNLENALGAISPNSLRASRKTFSDGTIASSLMENNHTSQSSTMTSMSSIQMKSPPQVRLPTIEDRICADEEISNPIVLNNNNPGLVESKELVLMTVRLQKQTQSYSMIYLPSSWKILNMYKLSISSLNDPLSMRKFFHFKLCNELTGQQEFTWVIPEDNKFNYLETIGKAGMLVKVSDEELYMIECKGKKALKRLFEVL